MDVLRNESPFPLVPRGQGRERYNSRGYDRSIHAATEEAGNQRLKTVSGSPIADSSGESQCKLQATNSPPPKVEKIAAAFQITGAEFEQMNAVVPKPCWLRA